jgi:hypothetical protein
MYRYSAVLYVWIIDFRSTSPAIIATNLGCLNVMRRKSRDIIYFLERHTVEKRRHSADKVNTNCCITEPSHRLDSEGFLGVTIPRLPVLYICVAHSMGHQTVVRVPLPVRQ